jgi:putative flippase GtrA
MKQYKTLALFLSVGAASAVVNFGSFYAAYHLLAIDYQVAASIAYALSVAAHFLGNHLVTFRSAGTEVLPRLKKYAVMLAINYVVTLLTITFCVSVLGLSPYLGVVIAIAATVTTGYLISQKWVFKIA